MSTTRFMLTGPSGKSVELTDQLVAGRNPDCDIVLVDGHPSRRHAQLTVREGSVWVEDLGSANGTYVNESQITTPTQLRAGDQIRFDTERWQLTVSGAAALEAQTVVRGASGADHQTVIPKPAKSTKAPGSWADPDSKGGGPGTKLFDPKDLQKMLQEGGPVQATAAAIDAPYLSVKSGALQGKNLKLEPKHSTNVWEIGSEPDKDIAIIDDGVSGFHATIRNEGARWKLTDQMSANGTFVNGAKISVHFLKSGDRIRFGPTDCVFQLPTGSRGGSVGKRSAWIIAAAGFVVTASALALLWWFT